MPKMHFLNEAKASIAFDRTPRLNEFSTNCVKDQLANQTPATNISSAFSNEINRYNFNQRNNKKLARPANQDVIQQFIKTRLCPHYKQNHCTNGANCTFAHSENELRPKPDLRNTKLCDNVKNGSICDIRDCSYAHTKNELRVTENLKTYKTSLCNFYGKGICKNEEKCRFAHGEHELRSPQDNAKLDDIPSLDEYEDLNLVETNTTTQSSDHGGSQTSESTLNNETLTYGPNVQLKNCMQDERGRRGHINDEQLWDSDQNSNELQSLIQLLTNGTHQINRDNEASTSVRQSPLPTSFPQHSSNGFNEEGIFNPSQSTAYPSTNSFDSNNIMNYIYNYTPNYDLAKNQAYYNLIEHLIPNLNGSTEIRKTSPEDLLNSQNLIGNHETSLHEKENNSCLLYFIMNNNDNSVSPTQNFNDNKTFIDNSPSRYRCPQNNPPYPSPHTSNNSYTSLGSHESSTARCGHNVPFLLNTGEKSFGNMYSNKIFTYNQNTDTNGNSIQQNNNNTQISMNNRFSNTSNTSISRNNYNEHTSNRNNTYAHNDSNSNFQTLTNNSNMNGSTNNRSLRSFNDNNSFTESSNLDKQNEPINLFFLKNSFNYNEYCNSLRFVSPSNEGNNSHTQQTTPLARETQNAKVASNHYQYNDFSDLSNMTGFCG